MKTKDRRKGEVVLTEKQAAFARHIFEGKSLQEAYVAAGYDVGTTYQIKNRARVLNGTVGVQREITRLQGEMIKRSTWDAFRVFKEYTDLFNTAKGDDDRQVQLSCLAMISKFIGMHVERKELTLKLGDPSDDPQVLDDQITRLAKLVGRNDIIPLIELDPSQVVDITESEDSNGKDLPIERGQEIQSTEVQRVEDKVE